MNGMRDWLKGVVRILEADTGDLRELAIIGGADPATLYIGTNLDGVDIRGQDLRGMALPGLDKNRVRLDSDTQLDALEPAFLLDQTLIFVVDPNLDPYAALGRDIDARVFALSEEDAFLHAASNHAGPVLVISSLAAFPAAALAATQLRSVGRAFVSIAVEPARSPHSDERRLQMAEALKPMVSVQRASGMFMPAGALGGEIRDLIRILISDWPNRDRYLLGRCTIFMRAHGVGADPVVDAAAQIFDRLWNLRSSVRDATVVAIEGAQDQGGSLSRLVISRLLDVRHVIERRRPAGSRLSNLAVFKPVSMGWDNAQDAFEAITSALVQSGWKLDWHKQDPGHYNFRMAAAGPVFSGRIKSAEDRWSTNPSAWNSIDTFSFTDVQTLVITPDADIATVADRMLIAGEFWVSSRDLMAFPPGASSLWLLLASQLRRLGRSMDGKGRQLYLRLILAAAFEAREVTTPHRNLLGALVYEPHAFDTLKVTPLSYSFSPDGARCRLRVSEKWNRQDAVIAEVELVIDVAGVRVADVTERLAPRLSALEAGGEWIKTGGLFDQIPREGW